MPEDAVVTEGSVTVIVVQVMARLYAPGTLDPEDEDAVNAWVAQNHRRVREAAAESDDILVADAYTRGAV